MQVSIDGDADTERLLRHRRDVVFKQRQVERNVQGNDDDNGTNQSSGRYDNNAHRFAQKPLTDIISVLFFIATGLVCLFAFLGNTFVHFFTIFS